VIVDDVEGVVPVDDVQRTVFFFLSIFSILHGGVACVTVKYTRS